MLRVVVWLLTAYEAGELEFVGVMLERLCFGAESVGSSAGLDLVCGYDGNAEIFLYGRQQQRFVFIGLHIINVHSSINISNPLNRFNYSLTNFLA